MSVMMMTFGLMPLGAVPAGIAAQSIGAPPVVAVAAVLFIMSTLGIFAAAPALRNLDRSMEEGRERETARRAVLAAGEPGPITVTASPHAHGSGATERL